MKMLIFNRRIKTISPAFVIHVHVLMYRYSKFERYDAYFSSYISVALAVALSV